MQSQIRKIIVNDQEITDPNIHSFFYKNNFIRTRASYLTKS